MARSGHSLRARFLSSASGLARRERKLADHWENAAVLRYLHGRDAFAGAEELGNRLISHLAGGWRPTVREIHELEDACVHACTLDRRQHPELLRTARSSGSRSTTRSPIVDQAELRWRIRRDLTRLTLENALAGTGTTREAERHLAPWLTHAAAVLDTPMSIDGLEDIAAQWRGRRAPYMLANLDWADVIIVEAIPRVRRSWWWKLTHGEEPPPAR
ncbi:hypothetical protein P3H15_45240 [Rhodococcus sp. T2V]|uniref:hypothetical protein n=1 Tax=Rhodococcus sp. T2V TaxID=3034164 RepID=UPI0023E12D7D|nr:hypothetical protein [Rhodococcus sp. T2V]MDF3312179.1 hypothetical protein [Rhodococcus sp. T2V]